MFVMKPNLAGLVLAMAVACSRANDLGALQTEAIAVAVSYQPTLDVLVDRVRALKRDLSGNLPGWQNMLRSAELASDELGLPPFTQGVAPGASWRPSPATLLGIGSYVRERAMELAKQGKRHELQYLVEDERRRYELGIADVDRYLGQVETWLAHAREPRDPR